MMKIKTSPWNKGNYNNEKNIYIYKKESKEGRKNLQSIVALSLGPIASLLFVIFKYFFFFQER